MTGKYSYYYISARVTVGQTASQRAAADTPRVNR